MKRYHFFIFHLLVLTLFMQAAPVNAGSRENSYTVETQVPIGGNIGRYVEISGIPSAAVITNVQVKFDYIAYGVVQNYVSIRLARGYNPGPYGGSTLIALGQLAAGNPGTFGWQSVNYWNGQSNPNGRYYFNFSVASGSPYTCTVKKIYVRVFYKTGFARVQSGVSATPSSVGEGESFTASYKLQEENGAAITFAEIALAVLDENGSHLFDLQKMTNVGLAAHGSVTYQSSGYLNNSGHYQLMARGRVAGGNWFNFQTSGTGVNPGEIRVTAGGYSVLFVQPAGVDQGDRVHISGTLYKNNLPVANELITVYDPVADNPAIQHIRTSANGGFHYYSSVIATDIATLYEFDFHVNNDQLVGSVFVPVFPDLIVVDSQNQPINIDVTGAVHHPRKIVRGKTFTQRYIENMRESALRIGDVIKDSGAEYDVIDKGLITAAVISCASAPFVALTAPACAVLAPEALKTVGINTVKSGLKNMAEDTWTPELEQQLPLEQFEAYIDFGFATVSLLNARSIDLKQSNAPNLLPKQLLTYRKRKNVVDALNSSVDTGQNLYTIFNTTPATVKMLKTHIVDDVIHAITFASETEDELAYFTIGNLAPVSHTITLYPNIWNMRSIPSFVQDNSINAIFPGVNPGNVYRQIDGRWQNPSVLVPGECYWIWSWQERIFKVEGSPVQQLEYSLQPGWNMIGSLSHEIAATAILVEPEYSVYPRVLTREKNGNYGWRETLDPGMGYWIYAYRSCRIILQPAKIGNAVSGKKSTFPITAPDELPETAEIEAASSNSQSATFAGDLVRLYPNYPNPFNPETTISFYLPKPSAITLKIYNINGNLIRTLKDDYLSAGRHNVVWDGRDSQQRRVASGPYLYQLRSDAFTGSQKMLLLY